MVSVPEPRVGRGPRPSLGRRTLLAGAAAGLVAATGCASGPPSTRSVRPATPRATDPRYDAASRARQTFPGPQRRIWRPDPDDVDPAAKLAAARLVEAIGSWDQGRGGPNAAARRIAALGQPSRLAGEAGALLGVADSAMLRVVEAQTGGLLATSASVLVVCRQWRRSGSGPSYWGGTTVDVRLVRRSAGWQVTELHPARPGAAQHPLSSLQHQVLSATRIVLPPAAVADVRSGNVHDSVLRALLELSVDFRIGVSVVRSGHPTDVFGTRRPSDHPVGRAFDTFRIDGLLVVDAATPRPLVTRFMSAAQRAGSYNVGGPYLLSGPGNQFFSDATHRDHVHVGFAA